MGALAQAFRDECSAAPWNQLDLDSWLAERIDSDLAARLGTTVEDMARALGRAAALGRLDVETSAEGAGERCLAAACSEGRIEAIAVFRAEYLDGLRPALAGYGLDDSAIDDVLSKTIERLLVGKDGPSKLEIYAGQGRLRGLVKVAATRLALDEARRRRRHPIAGESDLAELSDPERDPELAYLKQTYRSHFREAFAVAAQALSPRARNLLRMHLIHRVTLEQLATSYSVHRATIVRWLAQARQELLETTEAEMRRRLEVSEAELHSIMGLIGSRLDASVARLFTTSEG